MTLVCEEGTYCRGIWRQILQTEKYGFADKQLNLTKFADRKYFPATSHSHGPVFRDLLTVKLVGERWQIKSCLKIEKNILHLNKVNNSKSN